MFLMESGSKCLETKGHIPAEKILFSPKEEEGEQEEGCGRGNKMGQDDKQGRVVTHRN